MFPLKTAFSILLSGSYATRGHEHEHTGEEHTEEAAYMRLDSELYEPSTSPRGEQCLHADTSLPDAALRNVCSTTYGLALI